MSRWTQDGAHVAADALITAGLVGMMWRGGWGPVVLAVAGVLAVVALRSLEAYDGWREAKEALAEVLLVKARLAAVEEKAEEAKKQASGALNAASTRNAAPRAPSF